MKLTKNLSLWEIDQKSKLHEKFTQINILWNIYPKSKFLKNFDKLTRNQNLIKIDRNQNSMKNSPEIKSFTFMQILPKIKIF